LLLDSSGSITDRYSYDAWGNPIEQVGNTLNPLRWNVAAGYEWTPATGLAAAEGDTQPRVYYFHHEEGKPTAEFGSFREALVYLLAQPHLP